MTLLAIGLVSNSNTNSVGFDQNNYSTGIVILVPRIYDSTDFVMFGGGVDIEYDTNALLFIGFTQAALQPDTDIPASLVGSLTAPGLLSGTGIGTFESFEGITRAGTIGTFAFGVPGTNNPAATSCCFALCILPTNFNPSVSLAGEIVTYEPIGKGISGANIAIPSPAASWLIPGGLAGLPGFGLKSI